MEVNVCLRDSLSACLIFLWKFAVRSISTTLCVKTLFLIYDYIFPERKIRDEKKAFYSCRKRSELRP